MSLLLASNSGGSVSKQYVDDVFSTYLYTGNGSTQTITNGIDLAGKGGLVWIKTRAGTFGHYLCDSERGATKFLQSNSTVAQDDFGNGPVFNSDGFTTPSSVVVNANTVSHASWTFRRAPKFFDVVTYTGNGSAPRSLTHNLGVRPGTVIIKRTDSTGDWWVFHRSAPNQGAAYTDIGGNLYLNATDAADTGTNPFLSACDETSFTLSTNQNAVVNINTATYVAYIFAHDTDPDGIIQCGSWTGNGSSNNVINLGWEPQFLLVKSTTSTTNQDWYLIDNMRGFPVGAAFADLKANTSASESVLFTGIQPTSTGFEVTNNNFRPNGATYIYLAIRRQNKPPTSATEVYNAKTRTGTDALTTVTGVGFPPDMIWPTGRSSASRGTLVTDRLRGNDRALDAYATSPEDTNTSGLEFNQDGWTGGPWSDLTDSTSTWIDYFFRRAPSFFDVVCYTGTGSGTQTISHGLGVQPELVIVKARGNAPGGTGSGSFGVFGDWWLWSKSVTDTIGANAILRLNATNATNNLGGTISPITNVSSNSLRVIYDVFGPPQVTNGLNVGYVAYLFATLPGISKVGSYTGNGTSQTIDCGFITGARFVLIKRIDSTGDWYVWDTARGIVSANDPHLSLNSTAAEVVTDDSVDPESSGFIVNQVAATNVNVNAASYIFLAIA